MRRNVGVKRGRDDSRERSLTRGAGGGNAYGPPSGSRPRARSPSPRGKEAQGKQDRELFIGDVGSSVSEKELRDFLNNSMKVAGLVPQHIRTDPIIDCRITNQFAFIEFSRAEDATKGLSLNNIPFKGSNLKIRRPSKYDGPVKEGKTWQEVMAEKNGKGQQPYMNSGQQQSQTTAVISKSSSESNNLGTIVYREVHISQLPPNLSERDLQDFFGGVLQKMGLSSTFEQNPVEDLQLNGSVASVLLRTVEDAANILNINNLPLKGHRIRVERPPSFDGGVAGVTYHTWDELHASWISGQVRVKTAGSQSRILRISNIATREQLQDASFYLETIDELKAESAPFGTVRSVTVPRPATTSSSSMDSDNGKDIGKAFIEMASVDEAKKVLLALKGRSYNQRLIDIKFFPEDKYRSMQYSYEPPRIVLTASYGPVYKETILNASALAKIWENSAQQANSN